MQNGKVGKGRHRIIASLHQHHKVYAFSARGVCALESSSYKHTLVCTGQCTQFSASHTCAYIVSFPGILKFQNFMYCTLSRNHPGPGPLLSWPTVTVSSG